MKSNQEILELEKALLKLESLHASFDYLKVTIASPKRIKNWAQRKLPSGQIVGEVLYPETINFRTHEPQKGGLFCEIIFGPTKNWKCKCGKYAGFLLDKICENCKVELIESRVRRYRMGYVDLHFPVTHLWYLKGIPRYLCILLRCFDEKLSLSDIEQIIYFKEGDRIISPFNPLLPFFDSDFKTVHNQNDMAGLILQKFFKKKLLPDKITSVIEKRSGTEIIKAALENINLSFEIKKARNFIENLRLKTLNTIIIPDKGLMKRIRILESFLATKVDPSWMILTSLPVLPPTLRPLVELENGRLVAADINEIYRLLVIRNYRVLQFMKIPYTPDLIILHARKLLQEVVDSLIDNARVPKERTLCLNNKPLKSLTEILEGKQGRFRQSLLGKRVDYSGRSVIIVNPTLRLNQCGLPYEMLVELFQPFLINALLKTKIQAPSHNTKLAQLIIKKNKPFVWTLVENLTKNYSILLNRAPTLHRFGIQAFDPVLILGQAIHLHPLVCTGFNADFDGDQMAVHLPLYETSQLEARTLMRPCYNILSPSNGEVILKPTQDMVIGCYYLTLMLTKRTSFIQKWYSNENEALLAFYQKKINIHTSILVRYRLNEFKVKIENGKLKFFETITDLQTNEKEIIIFKLYQVGNYYKKYFLVTNIGIFIAHQTNINTYQLTDIFLETTPGRLIFSINFKKAINR
jgi:DNA-directed RNA polymerase subunit beta'